MYVSLSTLVSDTRSLVASSFSLVIGVCRHTRGNEASRTRLIGLNLHVVSLSYADGLNKIRSLSTLTRRREDDREEKEEQQAEQRLG